MTKQQNINQRILHKASSKRKLYVFLFCLGLSVFFWLLNALSNNFTTDAIFNVAYINQPTNKVVLNKLPNQLTISIKGLGFDLMAYKLSINTPSVSVDLSKLKGLNSKQKSSILSTASFNSHISNQLGEQIEIKSIQPDSIRFLFDERTEKNVEVLPNVQLNFEKQYQLYGEMIVKPAITKVSGPSSIIDTLTAVYTEGLILNELSENTTASLGFYENYRLKKITFTPEKVIVHIPVEKFTEKSIMVKIKPINVPDSIELKAIPNEVEVKFLIPLSKMVSLESAIFKAEIDYSEINDNFNHKLKVEMVKFPDYIQSISLNPRKVEYILKKK